MFDIEQTNAYFSFSDQRTVFILSEFRVFEKSWFGGVWTKLFPLMDTETQTRIPVLWQMSSQEKEKLI